MNAKFLCIALAILGFGEKDFLQRIEETGGTVYRSPGINPRKLIVIMPPTTTDENLDEVNDLRGLECLSLIRTTVTDNGLQKLSCLRGLRGLVLSPGITDEGLRHLEVLTNLESLNAEYCPKITMEGIARFKNTVPNCKVYCKE